MAWETRANGRYFYISRRVDGRATRTYVGRGPTAEMAADLILERRVAKAAGRDALRAERERLEPLERAIAALDAGCHLLIAAALTAEGYHRHDRGAWRRRRVQEEA